jgi:Integrase zinc binding domain
MAIRQPNNPNTQYSEPIDGPTPTFESFFSLALDNDNLLDCFVNLPSSEGLQFVLDYAMIADAQTRDALLQQKAQEQPQHYVPQLLALATMVTCYIPEPNAPWKIYLPAELVTDATRWYHLALGHIGSRCLLDTMQMHFYAPGLQQQVENITRQCNACQRCKNIGRPYGELAAREAALTPWSEITVNTIGPWTLQLWPSTSRV